MFCSLLQLTSQAPDKNTTKFYRKPCTSARPAAADPGEGPGIRSARGAPEPTDPLAEPRCTTAASLSYIAKYVTMPEPNGPRTDGPVLGEYGDSTPSPHDVTCVRASSSVEAPMSLSFVSAAPEGPGPRHEASRGGALSGVTARGHFLSPRTYLIITESN